MRLIDFITTLIVFAIALTVGNATAQAPQGDVPRAMGCTSGQAYDAACDVNHDGTIDVVDIQLTAGHWGQSGTYSAAHSGVPKTGQSTCYDSSGNAIPCANTGQDGDLQTGNPWPVPRFTDNADGTVTDRLTGLVWLKNARCEQFFLDDTTGRNERPWSAALIAANSLSSGYCGLTDSSIAGDWRLPSVRELHSLVHYGFFDPALPNTAGTGHWTAGDPFLFVQSDISSLYWSNTTLSDYPINAWIVRMYDGLVGGGTKTGEAYVWPVRDQ